MKLLEINPSRSAISKALGGLQPSAANTLWATQRPGGTNNAAAGTAGHQYFNGINSLSWL